MKTLSIDIYEFDELSDEAKDKARDWYRQGALDYDWWDCTFDDASYAGLEITSFDLDRNRHAKGHFTKSAQTVAGRIVDNHSQSCETHKTAKAFLASVEKLDKESEDFDEMVTDLEEDFLKDILEDYSILLQHEYEYLLNDKSVDEMIKANGYTFRADGKREG